jgi:lipid-A-disaccharide synthase
VKIFISTGEVSGDFVGAGIAAEIAARRPAAEIFGVGGSRMAAAGVAIDFGTNHLGTVGITEPIFAIPALTRALGAIRRRVRSDRPSAALLVGNDVFNVLLGRWFRRRRVPTLSYMPPQTWIWRSLARPIARSFDEILTSFPPEQEVYSATGVRSVYVGHYLADSLSRTSRDEQLRQRRRLGIPGEARVVGLLPGSRVHEIRSLAPVLLDAAARLLATDPSLRFVVPLADPVYRPALEAQVRDRGLAERVVLSAASVDAMRASDVLAVASGTATLEAALLGVPMVIVYRVSAFTMGVVRGCIRAGLIASETVGLPNLLAGRPIVPELRNRRATADNVAREVAAILKDPFRRREMEEGFRDVAETLSGERAFEKVAEAVIARAEGRAADFGDARARRTGAGAP